MSSEWSEGEVGGSPRSVNSEVEESWHLSHLGASRSHNVDDEEAEMDENTERAEMEEDEEAEVEEDEEAEVERGVPSPSNPLLEVVDLELDLEFDEEAEMDENTERAEMEEDKEAKVEEDEEAEVERGVPSASNPLLEVIEEAWDLGEVSPYWFCRQTISRMTRERLNGLILSCRISAGFTVRLVRDCGLPYHSKENELCVYKETLKAGVRFPLHWFCIKLLQCYDLAPAQLHP